MLVAAMLPFAHAGALLAQEVAKPGPPPPGNPLLAYFIALVLFGVVAAGALKGAKRSHQD